MIELPGYQVLEQIYESANSVVYRASREQDDLAVILKVLKEDYPAPAELTRYKQEYEIARNLELDGIVKAYGLEAYQRTLVIILEDFGAFSLKQLLNGYPESVANFSLAEFLKIAIKIAEILGQIHSSHVIHKDINPSNILFNPKTGQLKIIDFGISTQLTRENPTLKNPNVLEGTLAYISPEQTGRMNRSLDYRTDFYSLGVTFYELLTGKLPFETTDALELVHCHIAKQPVPPNKVDSNIPQTVSNIVMKLMAKTAEERYQSTWGIKADLEECFHQLQAKGEILEFTLGTQDISDRFQIPQKLYGREAEVETLLTAFERVSQGTTEMMLVAGHSGIGKSVLVAEVHKPITQKRGHFISGKFDQFQRNIPYSAIASAFKELVRQLLTESETQLNLWQAKLLTALGSNGQVIIDVIPEVELIIGKQSAISELGLTESQNRFNLVFSNFIRAFCTKEHPLVIFLDDLQWADSATLKLIELMMNDTNTKYLFLIGAYRDNEVSPAHPLMMTLDGLTKEGVEINQIDLKTLELESISQLVADTIYADIASVKSLAELIIQKTEGNPFFVNEFLKTLHIENLLNFNLKMQTWQWDIAKIESQDITDNVVELMISKLKKMPESTQRLLQLAACVGANFDLMTLSIISKQSSSDIYKNLIPAVTSGSIVPTSELDTELLIHNYKFLHDRVQQAAYTSIDESRKSAIHLQIGRLLLQNTAPEVLLEKIFEIVDHLNLGVELVTHQEEREQLIKLNLMAGQKAKLATAYAAAINYLRTGLQLLSADSWQSQYDLTLALHEEAAEAAYLNGDFAIMEQFAESVLNHAKTVPNKIKVYDVKIQAAGAKGNFKDAIRIGLQVLKLLGVILPEQPSELDIHRGFEQNAALCAGKEIEELVNLPDMTEPEPQAAIYILSSISAAAYIAAPQLMLLIVLSMVNLSIEYGHSLWSAFSYACQGLILCGVVQDIELGYKFGKLSLTLVNQFNAKRGKSRALEVLGAHVIHWKEHFKATLPIVSEGYRSGVETGEFEFAAYCAFFVCDHSYFIGCELTELERMMATYSKAISQIRRQNPLNWVAMFRQAVLNLLGCLDQPSRLVGDAYNEEQWLPFAIQENDRLGLHLLYLNKLILSYLFGEKHEAKRNAVRAEQYLDGVTAMVVVPLFYFYDSLAHLSIFVEAEKQEQQAILNRADANQEKMKLWANHAPMNFLHKFHLVEAEKARVLGKFLEAEEFYEKAISGACENEYIQEEALAYELAAKFYVERGRLKISQTYMKEAHYAYTRWGAKVKVEDLEAKYPQLLSKPSASSIRTSTATITIKSTTGNQQSEALDLATVMKASQAISGEIVLDKLLANLMKILIENAGAQTGFLILDKAGEWVIEASGQVDSECITVLQSISIDQNVPMSLVNYVTRTQETIVKNNAAKEGRFTNDPYIKANQTKSILCAPLINQGQLSGIVYLENNLTTGAFTSDRLEVIQLLSGQAAIAITNAKLYTEVKQSDRKFRSLFNQTFQFTGMLDTEGILLEANKTALDFSGLQLADVVGKPFWECHWWMISRETQTQLQSAIKQALQGTFIRYEVDVLGVEHRTATIDFSIKPIVDESGQVEYLIVEGRDISDRKKAEAEREQFTQELFQLNEAFSRFVPRQFLQSLARKSITEIQLGESVQKQMSVLFSDIRGFTTRSEQMTPEDTFHFINGYLRRMEPAIIKNGGFIDKYVGDAIMALFEGSADRAVKAGITMLNLLAEYNQSRQQRGRQPIEIGIGINTGSLMLGTVGGNSRIDTTVIGDAVNLSSRLEQLTKVYKTPLLVSHHTVACLEEPTKYALRAIARLKVRGKAEKVEVFEVFDADPLAQKQAKLETKPMFEFALTNYSQGAIGEAKSLFEECVQKNPGDRVAQIYLQQCA